MEVGLLGAVVEAGIGLLRHDAVAADAVDHVMRSSALGEIDLTVHADIFDRLLTQAVAHHPHLGEVHRLAAGLQDLALEERMGRETPAGAAAVLVLHGGDGHDFRVGEDVAFAFPAGVSVV